jgi:1,4-dihydroxy-6-naphthoate synthase
VLTVTAFDRLYRRLREPKPAQGVVIHEMRFTYAADGLTLLRDLGAHWEERTGHPIPLGAVALRRSLQARDAALPSRVEALIRASLLWSRAHPAAALELCRRHAQSLDDSVLKAHIDLYVNDFSLDLGTAGDEAVAYFLGRLQALRTAP